MNEIKSYFVTPTGELTDLHKNLHSLVQIGLIAFVVYKLAK